MWLFVNSEKSQLVVDMPEVSYEPISAKDALKQIRDFSNIIIDLAYSSVLYEDKSLAMEVDELRDTVIRLNYLLCMSLQIAVRDGKDAEGALPLSVLGQTSTGIVNSSANIAHVILKGLNIHPALKELKEQIARDLMRGEIKEESILKGFTIAQINEKMNYSISIISVQRDGRWIFTPTDDDLEIQVGDIIIARGSSNGISLLKLLIGGSAEEIVAPKEDLETERTSFENNLVNNLIALKDTSEVMVDLAYGAILYNNRELAQIVTNMEKRVDAIRNKGELAILRAAKETSEDLTALQGLIRIIEAAEDISDLANEIARVVLAGLPSHPIIELIIGESAENIFQITVDEMSIINGKTIPAGNYLDEFGIRVIAMKRAGGHFFKPRRRLKIRTGDVIIFTGSKESFDAFQQREQEEGEKKEAELQKTKEAAEAVVDEVVEKISEEISHEVVKFVSKQTGQEVAGEAVENAIDKFAKKIAVKTAEEIADDIGEETTQHMIEQLTDEIVQETIRQVEKNQPDISDKAKETIQEAVEKAINKQVKGIQKDVTEAAKQAAEVEIEEKSNVVKRKAKKAAAEKAAEEAETVIKDTVKSETEKVAKKAATEAIKEATTVKEPEELVKEAATEVAKETADKVAIETAEQNGKRVATKAASEAAREVVEKESKEIATKAAKKAVEEKTKEVINKEVKSAAKKAATEAAEKVTNEAKKS
jgi:uncharacterized protein with PhoU and TrkA domain